MSKKNIDKLFQEKFKDFREVPDDRVWDRIEVTLDENKKSRNIIPIWWKLGAIAAGLALLLYLLGPFKGTNPELPIITNSEKPEKPAIENQQEIRNSAITEVEIGNTDKKEEKVKISKDVPDHSNENINTSVTSVNNTGKGNPGTEQSEKKQLNKTSPTLISNSGEGTQWADNKKSDAEKLQPHGFDTSKSNERSNSVDKLVQNAPENQIGNKGVQPKKSEIGPSSLPQNATNTSEPIVAVDTTGTIEKKSIFEVLDDKDKPEEVAQGKKERWSLEPSIAPVYFNAAGEGSSIAPNFVTNSKSGEVSLSYGVLVSYKIGKKWSIRSGLQKSNYGYSTNDISYTSTFGLVSIANFDNINYNANSENLIVQNQNPGKPLPGMAIDVTAKNPSRTGKMLQQFGYLEIPMEANYALLDKKFGVDLIGGVSSLFLTDNSVILESGDQNTELGEANNINSVNFSANFGFGLNYQLMPKVHLNVEPIFKYQLNTFSNTAGSFRPFSIGVYSGLNFKF